MSFHPAPLPVGRTNDRQRLYPLPLPLHRRPSPRRAAPADVVYQAAYDVTLHNALDELRTALTLATTRYGVTVAFADMLETAHTPAPLLTLSASAATIDAAPLIHINRACLHSGSPLALSLLATRLLGLAARLSAGSKPSTAVITPA